MTELSPLLKQATPMLADRGEGVYLFTDDGGDGVPRRFLDFTAGIGVVSTGHCHPRVVQAVRDQVGKLIHGQYTTVSSKPLRELIPRLGEVLPTGLDSVFFANAGSESVEAALRLARHATGRQNVITFHGGFHGRTMAAASMTTSGTKVRSGFGPMMPGVAVAPFPYAHHYGWSESEAVEFAVRELDYLLATVSAPADTAAFLIEPVLGEGGYVPTPPEFMRALRERADAHGILLIVDEIQTGFGRTGTFWCLERADIQADILVLAKGIASGFPLSAMAASHELMAKGWAGSQGGTYGANPVACAAAMATLDVIREEKLVDNAAEMGARLRAGLEELAGSGSGIGEVRGLGLMQACEFDDPARATAVQQRAAELGLLLLTCGAYGQVVRMIPPLVVNAEQIDEGLSLWERALSVG